MKPNGYGIFICRWEAPLIRNPILRVLSSMQTNGVKCLLMGGQACVLYGAAEFSRDTDFAILAEPANLSRTFDRFGRSRSRVHRDSAL